ncbi:MAG: HAD-IC family P-type ATPase [Actinomycetota bacterium]
MPHTRTTRRCAGANGWAHLEVRGAHRPDLPAGFRRAVEAALLAVDGVRRAELNGALGRVVVELDESLVAVDDLLDVLDEVESAYGFGQEPFPADTEHPADREPLVRQGAALAGDLLGAAGGLAGRVFRLPALPTEAVSVLSVFEHVPRLRRTVEDRLGPAATELGLAWAQAALSAAAQGPLTPVVDAAHRVLTLAELAARRTAWLRREAELHAAPGCARTLAPGGDPRPQPLLQGPVERYTMRASLVTVAAAAALLPGGVPRAATALVVGTARAARLGREAYAATLGRTLASRGVVPLDPAALRRLDRVDAVLLDARVLAGGGAPGGPDLDPSAEALVAAARRLGRVVVAGRLGRRLGAEQVRPGRLAAAVRDLQRQGHGVLLVAAADDAALRAADCAVGVLTPDRHPPWGADLLCGPGLEPAWRVLEGAVLAREVSARSARLALVGSVAGGLVAAAGPARGALRRALVPVNVAALVAMAAGVWSATTVDRRPVPAPAEQTPWHALEPDEALRLLGSGPEGLSGREAARRQQASPPDPADQLRPVGLAGATLQELDNPLTPPLAAGAGVSAAVGAAMDAVLIGSTMAGTALLGGAQRVAAHRALRRLLTRSAVRVRLRRDGVETLAEANDLVPGDVLTLRSGDVVPADCRILQARGLEVDESSVTGESLPVAKGPAPSYADTTADRTSLLFEGTTVAAGYAVAVVVATGAATEVGRSVAAAVPERHDNGVNARLRRLGDVALPVAVGAAAVMLGVGALRGRLAASVGAAVSLAVAAVPEGLPFVANMAQLAAARRLAARGALVRNPATMEALGRVDVLCFDKTGTLTEGRITLRRVSDGVCDEPVVALSPSRRAVLAAALRASPRDPADGDLPHATDRAVLAGGAAAGVGAEEGAPGWRVHAELPFEPSRGFHAVLGRTRGGHLLCVKGAPEVVLPRCHTGPDGRPLSERDRAALAGYVDRWARAGHRVLAVAARPASGRADLDESRIGGLQLLGLLGLTDPVRPAAAAAVRRLRDAGVRVVMMTGDHPSTAEAVAAELDLLDGGAVVSGAQLAGLSGPALAALVPGTPVFARVTPADKVAVIRELRRAGRVVAMTGDGANDAPAIRLADVGVALGANGTSAAREAADVVVTDDRIETIIEAIVEGRAMWASVRDAVALLLGGNLGEIAFTLVTTLGSARPALNARQLLLVNLLTDLLPSMALAVRPPRGVTPAALLDEGPEASLGGALTRDVLVRAGSTATAATAGWLLARPTGTRGRAGTVALASLVGAQLAQTLAAARGDPLVTAAAVVSALALVGLVQNPWTSRFFGCRPLGPVGWGVAAGASVGGLVLASVAGRLARTPPRSRTLTACSSAGGRAEAGRPVVSAAS